jgi:hypothetical protein
VSLEEGCSKRRTRSVSVWAKSSGKPSSPTVPVGYIIKVKSQIHFCDCALQRFRFLVAQFLRSIQYFGPISLRTWSNKRTGFAVAKSLTDVTSRSKHRLTELLMKHHLMQRSCKTPLTSPSYNPSNRHNLSSLLPSPNPRIDSSLVHPYTASFLLYALVHSF